MLKLFIEISFNVIVGIVATMGLENLTENKVKCKDKSSTTEWCVCVYVLIILF